MSQMYVHYPISLSKLFIINSIYNFQNNFPDKDIMTTMMAQMTQASENQHQHDGPEQQQVLEVGCNTDLTI